MPTYCTHGFRATNCDFCGTHSSSYWDRAPTGNASRNQLPASVAQARQMIEHLQEAIASAESAHDRRGVEEFGTTHPHAAVPCGGSRRGASLRIVDMISVDSASGSARKPASRQKTLSSPGCMRNSPLGQTSFTNK